MKINKKIAVISFIFLVFFVGTVPVSVGVSKENLTIKAEWLSVTYDEFYDKSPHSWENKIAIEVGGGDLLSFENCGIIGYSDEEVVYMAEVVFGFEATAHTYVGFRDQYPYIDFEEEHKELFFHFVDAIDAFTTHTNDYSVRWDQVDTGIMREHDYHGYIPITVSIKETTPSKGSMTINGIEFTVPEYIADIMQVEVTNVRDGTVGDYNDIFTDANEVEGGEVKLDILDDDFSTDAEEVVDWFNSHHIGWKATAVERGQTLQQLEVGGSQSGATFHNPSPAKDKEFTFDINAQLTPEAYEYVQYIDITHAAIRFWRWGLYAETQPIEVLSPPNTYTAPKRVVAIHTTNPYLHWDFIVKTNFYAAIQSSAELTQTILSDPYLKKGDMVWDTSFTGDYKVDVPLYPTGDIWDLITNFFNNIFSNIENVIIFIIVMVFIILGIYIVIKAMAHRRIKQRIKQRW